MNKRGKFFLNGALLTLVGLAMRGVQLLFGAYISRAVGAEGVGLNTLIMTVYSFAVTFATSGISLTVTRLVASSLGEGKEGEDGKILRGALIYALAFGGMATLILFSLSGVIGVRIISDVRVITSLRILSLSLIPTALSAVFSGYFIAVRRVPLNAVTQVASQVLRIGVTVLLLLRLSDTESALTALAVGATVSEIIAFLIALVEFAFDRRKSTRVRGNSIKPVAKMAFPLAVSAYIRSALLTLEHSLIPKRLVKRGETGPEALASYGYLHGMALPLILYPLTPLSSFSGLLVPEFAEAHGARDDGRMRRIADLAINTTMVYAVACAVLIYLFSEELGYVIYDSYDAGHYIAMLAPVVPIMYLDHVTDAILKGIGEHIYSMWVNIADSCLSLVLVWFLIPIMGIAGYAVVIISMEAFNFILSVLRLRKRIRFRIDPIGSVAVPLCAALVASVLSDALFRVNGAQTTPALLIMKIVFAASVFLAVNIPLRAVGKTASECVKRRILKKNRQMP